MKIELLKEVIRKIVQQEIRSTIKKEVRSCLAEIILSEDVKKPSLKEDSSINMSDLVNIEENVKEEVTQPKKFVKYTNNDLLNQVLNETKGGVPREGQYVGLSDSFSSIGADPSVINESVAPVQVPETAPKEVKTVYQAMTKDYSKLMKAIDKKRNKA
jgi:hypothetical protein